MNEGDLEKLSKEDLTKIFTHVGFILVTFETIKSLIVSPIETFYAKTKFEKGGIFTNYEEDVLSRHKNKLEACLLYLRDFMKVIDSSDFIIIQTLRKRRNDLAHGLLQKQTNLNIEEYTELLEKSKKILLKLSNYQVYMEVGADPFLRDIDWNNIKGPEYVMLEEILDKWKSK